MATGHLRIARAAMVKYVPWCVGRAGPSAGQYQLVGALLLDSETARFVLLARTALGGEPIIRSRCRGTGRRR